MAGGIFDRLRARFPSRGRVEPAAARTLYVEEDAWGEVEILPAANADWCRAELDRIAAFSAEHRAPDGTGWTDIYVRKPPPVPLVDLRLPLKTLLDLLGAQLQRFDAVTSGSFYDPEPIAGARGFGPSPKTALIVIGDKDQTIVQSILAIAEEDDGAARLMTALESLPSGSGLMVVDWARGELIALRP